MGQTMTDLSERQPHIVVVLPDGVHVLCLTDIRRLAQGLPYHGDKAIMIQILATALRDLIDEARL
jgi:hypothetical protein